MSDTATQERRSPLDDFAAQTVREPSSAGALVPMQAQPVAHIFGAQKLAVRRDERNVLQNIRALAAAAGEEWYYRYPVKNRKKNRTDWIEGPSIKCTDDVARLYGNCEVTCVAQDFGSIFLFHARFVDLETGYALTRPFQQRKSGAKLGGEDDERREDIAMQIGASKATRNVVVHGLRTHVDFAFQEAKNALVQDIGRDIEGWRKKIGDRIGNMVELPRVEAVVGRPLRLWLAPDVARVIAMAKAIADGMATVDETFPPLGKTDTPKDKKLDDFASNGGSAGFSGAGEADIVDPNTGEIIGNEAGDKAAAAHPKPPAQAAAADHEDAPSVEAQREIIRVLLQTATRQDHPKEERVEALGRQSIDLMELYPELSKFIATVLATAGKVTSGQLKAEGAQKYLEGMIKSS